MSTIATFRVKRPRPEKLSDPHYDFSPDMLAGILATPDEKLNSVHYLWLFGPILPAGTYDETLYFLPLVFRYMVSDTETENVAQVINPVIGFISKNADKLDRDGILDAVRGCVRECLSHWTREFVVVHRVQPGRKPGTGYSDYEKNFGIVSKTVFELLDFKNHADLAVEFMHILTYNEFDPIKAAWYLAFARSHQERPRDRRAGDEPIIRLLTRKKRLRRAAELVKQWLVPHEASPTYWRDTFKLLNFD